VFVGAACSDGAAPRRGLDAVVLVLERCDDGDLHEALAC
jgi:hypothetical protein